MRGEIKGDRAHVMRRVQLASPEASESCAQAANGGMVGGWSPGGDVSERVAHLLERLRIEWTAFHAQTKTTATFFSFSFFFPFFLRDVNLEIHNTHNICWQHLPRMVVIALQSMERIRTFKQGQIHTLSSLGEGTECKLVRRWWEQLCHLRACGGGSIDWP